jgi:hypothetical protein
VAAPEGGALGLAEFIATEHIAGSVRGPQGQANRISVAAIAGLIISTPTAYAAFVLIRWDLRKPLRLTRNFDT